MLILSVNKQSMSKIRLTKEFDFEMSHALEGYDGPCRQIHGHSYKLFVTVIGSPCADPCHPKNGMVMDFGELKRIVRKTIVDPLDHAFVIRADVNNGRLIQEIDDHFGKTVAVDYQPTCENMIVRFAEILSKELPEGIELHSLRLHETATSYAEWHRSDNL